MKKITFVFVGIVYFVAIIVIAFLGVHPGVYKQTIDVTGIVLNEAENMGKGEHVTYPEGSAIVDSVYTLYARPDEAAISPLTGKSGYVTWNLGGIEFDYVIQIRDFNTIYESPDWRYGPTHFDLGAHVTPEDATITTLHYAVSALNGQEMKQVEIDDKGMMTFTEKLEDTVTTFTATITSADNSGIVCDVCFVVRGYIE